LIWASKGDHETDELDHRSMDRINCHIEEVDAMKKSPPRMEGENKEVFTKFPQTKPK
jgi:hypothetical protein